MKPETNQNTKMKTTTIYKICSAPDDSVALNIDEISEMIEGMKEDFEDYDIEVLGSISSNRLDNEGDYAIEYEIPADWMPDLKLLKNAGSLTWWETLVEFAESKGYEEEFDSSKFGSWGYKFVPEQTDEEDDA